MKNWFKNMFLLDKKNLSASGNEGESNFFKVTLFWQGADSRAFFLLVESIIEIRQNPFFKKILARGRLFLQVD